MAILRIAATDLFRAPNLPRVGATALPAQVASVEARTYGSNHQAIMDAVAALPPEGGIVYLDGKFTLPMEGVCYVRKSNVHFVGRGNAVVEWAGMSMIIVEHPLGWDNATNRLENVSFRNIRFIDPVGYSNGTEESHGIMFRGCEYGVVIGCSFSGLGDETIEYDGNSKYGVVAFNRITKSSQKSHGGSAIGATSAQDLVIHGNHIHDTHTGVGIVLRSPTYAGNEGCQRIAITNNVIRNTNIDTTLTVEQHTGTGILLSGDSGVCRDILVQGNIMENVSGFGIKRMSLTADHSNQIITQNIIRGGGSFGNTGLHGAIHLDANAAAHPATVTDNHIQDWGAADGGLAGGVYASGLIQGNRIVLPLRDFGVRTLAANDRVLDNYISGVGSTVAWNHRAGIHCSTKATVERNILSDCYVQVQVASGANSVGSRIELNQFLASRVSGNAMIANAGTNTQVRRNEGFPTETSGAVTISSAATSVDFFHNAQTLLGVTTSDLIVTPLGLGSATKWWVTKVDDFKFRINVDVAPGASGASFAWRFARPF